MVKLFYCVNDLPVNINDHWSTIGVDDVALVSETEASINSTHLIHDEEERLSRVQQLKWHLHAS